MSTLRLAAVTLVVASWAASRGAAADLPDLALVPADAAGFVHVRVGDALRSDHLKDFRELINRAGPQAIAAYQQKITERLKEAIGSADDERIRTELALFATKVDVAEELDRLRAHLDEVERVLRAGGAVGKRLDFLAQELNREANTLASKSAGPAVGDCALELKLLIEQIREQVQNLE